MSSENRDILLTTIGKARVWIDDLVKGRVSSFAEIARREHKVERHIRFLAPLAFVSPRLITTIIDGAAPADVTATELAKSLPYSWLEQQQRLVCRTSDHRATRAFVLPYRATRHQTDTRCTLHESRPVRSL